MSNLTSDNVDVNTFTQSQIVNRKFNIICWILVQETGKIVD